MKTNENTSPRVLKISGRVNLLLREIPKSQNLVRLAESYFEIARKITVGDLVSMAQSLNTQAANRQPWPSTPNALLQSLAYTQPVKAKKKRKKK